MDILPVCLLSIFPSPTSPAFFLSSLFSPLPFPFSSSQSYITPHKSSGAILPSYFKLVPLGASLFLPSHFCLLLFPPLVFTEDLLKVFLGTLPGTWHRAWRRCQSFRASHCRLAQVCCPAAWQGCPEVPWGPKGGHAYTFPIILEETLSFLLFLSSFLAPTQSAPWLDVRYQPVGFLGVVGPCPSVPSILARCLCQVSLIALPSSSSQVC